MPHLKRRPMGTWASTSTPCPPAYLLLTTHFPGRPSLESTQRLWISNWASVGLSASSCHCWCCSLFFCICVRVCVCCTCACLGLFIIKFGIACVAAMWTRNHTLSQLDLTPHRTHKPKATSRVAWSKCGHTNRWLPKAMCGKGVFPSLSTYIYTHDPEFICNQRIVFQVFFFFTGNAMLHWLVMNATAEAVIRRISLSFCTHRWAHTRTYACANVLEAGKGWKPWNGKEASPIVDIPLKKPVKKIQKKHTKGRRIS